LSLTFFILNDGRITRKLFLAPELTYQRLIIICRKTYFVAWSFDVACSCMYIICTLSLKKPCIYDIPSSVVCMAVRGCQAPEVQSSAPGPAAYIGVIFSCWVGFWYFDVLCRLLLHSCNYGDVFNK